MPQLVVHGGAGAPSREDWDARQRAVERALDDGWQAIGQGVVAAVLAATHRLEDEPCLNAAIGASLNADGEVELDAGLMLGDLRCGAVACVCDLRHPIDGAQAVLEDGRHALLVGEGASRLAASRGVARCAPSTFRLPGGQPVDPPEGGGGDTVGVVARDDAGRIAVAVSTGGYSGKLPGRVGDSPLVGCGFYADDGLGGVCATGHGEGFMRLVLSHWTAMLLADRTAEAAARAAIERLGSRIGGSGGLIVIDRNGGIGAAWNTPFMPWAQRST